MSRTAALVGRQAELDAIEGALGGESSFALVTGEAGIGKTRLVVEALRRADTRGCVTLSAACLPMTEKLSLLPMAEALRELDRLADGRVLATAIERLPRYVRIELARLLPRLGDGEFAPTSGQHDASARERLFTAFGELLMQVAGHVPLVLSVEDVHWADNATLDLLTYLWGAAGGPSLSLLVTCRSDEAPMDRWVIDWLAHCRSGMATEVGLSPLSREEVASQAAALIGTDSPDEFIDELYTRAEGNPFLTEQLVAAALALPAQGSLALPKRLPGGLSQLLVTRTRQVSDDARTVLTALAVSGRPLNESMLADITGLDGPMVRRALHQLAAVALLATPSTDGGCRPRHALLAEAVLADLLPDELISLHARVAEVLEGMRDPALSAEIAGHWAAAFRPMDELRLTVAAAAAATRVLDFAKAATHWQRAIKLCDQLPDAAATLGLDSARLHVEAIDALQAAGKRVAAGSLAEQAHARFSDWPDHRAVALIDVRTARYRQIDSTSAARPLFEEALRLFTGSPPSADQAEALASYALLCAIEGRAEMAAGELEKGLQIAEAADATASEIRLLVLLGHVNCLRGAVEEGFAAFRRGQVLADGIDDADPALRIAVFQSDALVKVGRLEEAWQVASHGIQRARRGGLGNTINAAVLLSNGAEAMLELGRTDDAAGVLELVTDGPPQLDDWTLHLRRAEVELRHGLVEEAARRLNGVRALPIGGAAEVDRDITLQVAEVDLWRRRPGEALNAVERALARCEGTEEEPFCSEMFVLGLRAAADLAEFHRARRDPEGEQAAQEAVLRLMAELDRMGGRPFVDHPFLVRIPADYASWTAEASRADGTSDADTWESVAMGWQRLQRPHRSAYALWRSVEAHAAEGHLPVAAARKLQSAASAAAGMAPLVTAITRLARQRRVPLDAADDAAQAITTSAPVATGLTERERQVLRLVCQGRTNSQIGAELYISRKTASVHVMNILRKLNVTNRTQAAALAERLGIFDDLESI